MGVRSNHKTNGCQIIMDFDTDQQMNQLRKTISIMELMCNSIDESIVLLNKQGEIKWCNTLFDTLVCRRHIEILGKTIYEIFDIKKIHAANVSDNSSLNLNISVDKWMIEEFSYFRNGKQLFLQVSVTKCDDEKDQLYSVIIRDISEQKKLHQQLEHLAHYDLLTNLPNRLQLQTFFKREIAKAKRHDRQLAVFFIDLNKFKSINDQYGHSAGDVLLKLVSERLAASVRDEDFVARFSGDEFVVVISEFDDKCVSQDIAKKIKISLDEPYNILGNSISNSASIGVSFYPSDGESASELLEISDQRMYKAKQSGDQQIRYT